MKVKKILSYPSYGQLNFKEFETNKKEITKTWLPLPICVQFYLLFYQLMILVLPNGFCSLLIGWFFIYTYNIYVFE